MWIRPLYTRIQQCPGPPQYRHSRFVKCCCFSCSDNGLQRRVVLISKGVGVFSRDGLYDSLEKGFRTTEVKVCSELVLGICNWCSKCRSKSRLSHHIVHMIAFVSDLVLRGKSRVNHWRHYVGHNKIAPSMLGHPREYRWRVDGNPQHKLRSADHLDVVFGLCWLSS